MKKKKNKEIFTPMTDYINLEKVISKLHALGLSIRLSCIMLKGFIDSKEEITKFIKKAKEWKVEQLTVRGVTTPQKSESEEVYSWTKKRELTKGQIIDISEFLEKEGNKVMTLDHGGIVYDYEGQNICLSDCLTIKPNSAELRQLIFFPDGKLRYDWQYEGALLI